MTNVPGFYPKKIVNNLVSIDEAEYIKNYLMYSNIKWAYAENTISKSFIPNYNFLENLIDSWQLVSLTFGNNEVHDQQTFEIIRPIIDNFIKIEKIKDFYLHKIKINTLFQKKDYQPYYFNTPHQDSADEEFSTLLYYVNDSDGNTFFFDSNEIDSKSFINLKVEDMIYPKIGTGIVFKSNQYHASSNPIKNQRRLVINIVFKAYE